MVNRIFICLFVLFLQYPVVQANDTDSIILSHIADDKNSLCYIEADANSGWYAEDIWNKKNLNKLLIRYTFKRGLIIPIFPTVYSPGGANFKADVQYYNFLLKQGGIKKNDKVLVIGSGSGSDVWVAWLKTQAKVYAIDINPIAVANTKATAQIGGFPVEAIKGDIREMSLPKGFSDFDYVLWNMPFIFESCTYATETLHDCDDGSIIKKFTALLPRLLKQGGKAIILNTKLAIDQIDFPNKRVIDLSYNIKARNADIYLCVLTLDQKE